MKKEIIAGIIIYVVITLLVVAILLQIAVKKRISEEKLIKTLPESEFYFTKLITVTPNAEEYVTFKKGRLFMQNDNVYVLESGTDKQKYLIASRSANIGWNKWHTLALCEGRICSITELYFKNKCIQVSIRTGGFLQTFE